MMKLTYLFHSGFVLETTTCYVVFDYWIDPAKKVVDLLQTKKPMYVLASHFHEDHFNPNILQWKKTKSNITYILSKDIYRRRRASKGDADVWLAKGGTWSNEHLTITAMGSNDSGVSWIVDIEGKRIFHAGDLNNWYARLLNEKPHTWSAFSEEGLCIDPEHEEKRYLGELKDLEKKSSFFDIVMFPIDGRIGNGYTKGGRQFIERFKVGLFVPMHFVVSGSVSAHRMKEFTDKQGIEFWAICHNGEELCF